MVKKYCFDNILVTLTCRIIWNNWVQLREGLILIGGKEAGMMEVRQVDQATLMFDKPSLDRSGTMNVEQVPVLIIKLYLQQVWTFGVKKTNMYNKKMRGACPWKSCHRIAMPLLCSRLLGGCLLIRGHILLFGRQRKSCMHSLHTWYEKALNTEILKLINRE